jgi:hypothetical protein
LFSWLTKLTWIIKNTWKTSGLRVKKVEDHCCRVLTYGPIRYCHKKFTQTRILNIIIILIINNYLGVILIIKYKFIIEESLNIYTNIYYISAAANLRVRSHDFILKSISVERLITTVVSHHSPVWRVSRDRGRGGIRQ